MVFDNVDRLDRINPLNLARNPVIYPVSTISPSMLVFTALACNRRTEDRRRQRKGILPPLKRQFTLSSPSPPAVIVHCRILLELYMLRKMSDQPRLFTLVKGIV